MQGNNDDQQNAGRLRVDGRNDWVSVYIEISTDDTL
jgi:hypothetical protein